MQVLVLRVAENVCIAEINQGSDPIRVLSLRSLMLRGMDTKSTMPGQLFWEVGYFGKPHCRLGLKKSGKDNNLPLEL